MSVNSVFRILKSEKLYPYKPTYSQFLMDADSDRRNEFCEVMENRFQHDPALLRKLAFSDECVFSLKGHVNKHNVHFWSHDNPHERFHDPGKTPTLTVWACISLSGVVAYDICS